MVKKDRIQPLSEKRLNYRENIKVLKILWIKSLKAIKSIFINISMILPFIIDKFFNILHQDRILWSKA
jgi:hypothetical protein